MLTDEQRALLAEEAIDSRNPPDLMAACRAALDDHARMLTAIQVFVRAHAFACDEWRRQSYIAPLFALKQEADRTDEPTGKRGSGGPAK